jgi:hypothetical protein
MAAGPSPPLSPAREPSVPSATIQNFDSGRPDSRPSTGSTVKSFLGRHPVLCLALLSPGIPEYLSSSSPLNTILAKPPLGFVLFCLQLAANLGLYLPGVLLIREAMIRWKKGWGSVLILGAAYGILEEGIALETLFYSRAGPVGAEGFYGHWLGVNWVWTAGILPVHMIFSISLPILLLGLALPATKGRSLVGSRGILLAFVAWAIDIPALMIVVHAIYHYWMGWTIFFGSLAAIGLLVFAAYRAPARFLPTRSGLPRVTPFQAGLLGLAFYFPILLIESFLEYWHVAAAAAVIAIVAYEAGLVFVVVRNLGTLHNERQLVAFAGGLLAVIAVFGFVAELPVPVTVVADVAAFWFLRHLWRKYPPTSPAASIAIPPGASATT